MRSMRTLLLVEDNPGDARLLREMFERAGLAQHRVTHVESMSEAEKYLANMRLISSCSTWGCPMRKDWKRYGGPAPPRHASLWWC